MPDHSGISGQTALAFDFGLRRLGVAVGQSLTGTAQPLTTLICSNGTPDWREIEKLQRLWQANYFVVGLPVNKDGSDTAVTVAARTFGNELKRRFQIPVHFFDERYSSMSAEELLKTKRQLGDRRRQIRKTDVDKFASAVILQNWFKEKG